MGAFRAAVFLVLIGSAGQSGPDPTALLKEADRLAWFRAWAAAEPQFLHAQKLVAARGDDRNALYAEVSAFRGALPRMAVPEASARLADYLEHSLVQADERLRPRVLIIKGETDQDLDPTLAEQSWREAQKLAESLGNAAWANRARGELGLVAFLQGAVGGAVVGLGQALKVAQSNGDVSSVARWLTLFHESSPRTAGRVAIAGTFTRAETADGERWVFQDVHPGGAAYAAGARPGDVLLSVQGKELVPPEATPFTLGERYEIVIRRPDGSTASPTLAVPQPKDKRQPVAVPDQVVMAHTLPDGIGLLRVSMFPGVLGMDVARDMTRAIDEMQSDRLIVDLRGNTGGGIGCLRLMSLLCDDRRGVGYSLGRDAIKSGRTKEQLPAFDRIPASKWGVYSL